MVAAYFGYVKIQGNFHVITPGEAYRSAQLNGSKLARHLRDHSIRSVLNLRGHHSGESWYEDELAVCSRLNVKHYDVALSASHELTEAQVSELLEVFRTAPRPILIHCQAGADRSGLVAAMWKVVVNKVTKTEAARELTFWYGHFPFGEKAAMDSFFEKWKP
jgi:undecaprenyl-diphosphatase